MCVYERCCLLQSPLFLSSPPPRSVGLLLFSSSCRLSRFLPSFRHIFRYGATYSMYARPYLSNNNKRKRLRRIYTVWQEHNQDMTGSIIPLAYYSKTPALNQVPAPSKFPYVVCKLKGPPAIKKVGAIDPPTHPRCVHSGGGREEREARAAGGSKFQFYSNFLSPPPSPDQPSGKRVGGGGRNFFILFRIYILPALRIPDGTDASFLIGTIAENRVMANRDFFKKKWKVNCFAI